MTDTHPRRFRMKLWPWLVFGWVSGHALAAVFLAAVLALDPTGATPAPTWVYLVGYAAGTAIAMPLLVIYFGLYVWWFRVTVGPGGLRGYDFWSWPMEVSWDGIAGVRPFSLAGLPFLLVSERGHRRRLWVPLFLTDYPGFAEAVAEEAGDDHPLAVALRERLADD